MSPDSSSSAEGRAAALALANRRLLKKLLWLVAGATLFGFALVPFYNVLCRVTGFNGKDYSANAVSVPASRIDTSRWVRVEFTGTVMPGLAWDMQPSQTFMKVHPGELVQATYRVRNLSGQAASGQAVPSISPGQASPYFQKIECFCFSRQTLAAGEEKLMPLTFLVKPELGDDVGTITLAYAFFAADGKTGASP